MTVTVYPRRGDLPPAVVVGEYAADGEPDLVIEVYGEGEDRVARAIAEMLALMPAALGQVILSPLGTALWVRALAESLRRLGQRIRATARAAARWRGCLR